MFRTLGFAAFSVFATIEPQTANWVEPAKRTQKPFGRIFGLIMRVSSMLKASSVETELLHIWYALTPYVLYPP